MKIHWIKAHQARRCRYNTEFDLHCIDAINVQADSLVSQYLQIQPTTAAGGPRRASRHFPTKYASLLIADRGIQSFISAKILSHIKGHQ